MAGLFAAIMPIPASGRPGPIPLDGRAYTCGGEVIFANGRRLPAEIEIDTSHQRPFQHAWYTPDGEMWYQLHEPELLIALGVAARGVPGTLDARPAPGSSGSRALPPRLDAKPGRARPVSSDRLARVLESTRVRRAGVFDGLDLRHIGRSHRPAASGAGM